MRYPLPSLLLLTLLLSSDLFANEAPRNNRSVEALRKSLKSSKAPERRLAAEELAKLHTVEAMHVLADALDEHDPDVTEAVVVALRRNREKCIPALMKALQAPKQETRQAAVVLLSYLGPEAKAAIPDLIQTLKHEDVEMRIQAASILAFLGAPAKKALPALIEASKDLGNVRRETYTPLLPDSVAVAAIAAIETIDASAMKKTARSALPTFLQVLQGKDERKKQVALDSLSRLGKHAKPAIPALKALLATKQFHDPFSCTAVLLAMGKEGEEAVLDITKSSETDLQQRREIMGIVSRQGVSEARIDTFVALLKDKEPKIRAEAAHCLLTFAPQGNKAIPALINVLGDEKLSEASQSFKHQEQFIVASTLSRFGRAAVPHLRKAMNDEKFFKRWQAIRALALMKRQAKAAVPDVKKALIPDNVALGIESATVLIHCDTEVKAAKDYLRRALKHDSENVRWYAMDAVGRLRRKGMDLIPEVISLLEDQMLRNKALFTLKDLGPYAKPAVLALVRELKTEKVPIVRADIASTFRNVGPEAKLAVPVLIEALQDKDSYVRYCAVEALGSIGPGAKDAVPSLILKLRAFRNSMIGNRKDEELLALKAVVTLGEIGPDAKAAVPQLLPFLRSADYSVRADAAKALGQIGPKAKGAVESLKPLLDDRSYEVQVWARFALARITGESEKHVAELMKLYPADAIVALEMLGADARQALPLLTEALEEDPAALNYRPDVETPTLAARAIGHLGTEAKSAIPRLIKMLQYSHPEHRAEAALTLGSMGPVAKDAIETLKKLLDDDEDEVVQAAKKALEQIQP